MSKLSKENFLQLTKYNKNILTRPPPQCESLTQLLKNPVLFDNIMCFYSFIEDRDIILDGNKYIFFITTDDITFRIRKKAYGKAASNKLLKYLLAMGIFQILPQQASDFDNLIQPNQNFLQANPNRKFPINACIVRKYTRNYLLKMDSRCHDLTTYGIKRSNISYLKLTESGLGEMAEELYPHHSRQIMTTRRSQLHDVISIIDINLDVYGFCTRTMLENSFLGTHPEWLLDRLLKTYGKTLRQLFIYKRPSQAEIEKFQLPNSKFIYLRKKED